MPITLATVCLLVLLIATVNGQAANSTTVPVAKLCYIVRPSNGATIPFLVSRFAVQLYRPLFPNYNWMLVPIAQNINTAIRDAVQAMVNTGEQCDALLGPGSSSYSIALSPVVDMPWIDFASTSVELSDKSVYSWFDRVITTDAQIGRAMADVIRGFGWKVINILSSNEAYGNSVAQQLVASLVAGGGNVALSQSLQVTATRSDVSAAFDIIEQASKSRIIAVGISSGSVLFASLINVTLTRRLHERYVFLFSESACSGDAQWRTVPGALCVTFRTNSSVTAPFLAAYNARNTTLDAIALAAYNRTQSIASIAYNFNIFAAFAHDATLLMLSTLNGAPSLSNRTDVLRRVRNITFLDGMTGRLQLDSNGDRLSASMQLLNINPSNAETTVGFIDDHSVNRFVNSSVSPTPVYWLNSYSSLTPPVDEITSDFQLELWMILLAAGCVVILIIFVVLLCIVRRHRAALKKFVSVGLLTHVVNAAIAIGVVVVKVLVGVNLYYDATSTGYIASYYVVMVIGILATLVDVFNRMRYIAAAMTTDEGLSFEDQSRWDSIILFGDFTTSALSDLPSVVITSAIISDGATPHRELLVSLAVITAFVCGIKISDVPKIFAYISNTDADDDDSDDLIPVQGTEEFTELAMSVRHVHADNPFAVSTRHIHAENPFLAVEPSASILAARQDSKVPIPLPSNSAAAQALNELPVDADALTRARHIARVHAIALKSEHFSKRIILKVYVVELLACFKLGVEHMLLLLPNSTSNTASTEHTPRGEALGAQFSGLFHHNERPWSPLGHGRQDSGAIIPKPDDTPSVNLSVTRSNVAS